MKYECDECRQPCTFRTNTPVDDGWEDDLRKACAGSNWHEVKEEPEKAPLDRYRIDVTEIGKDNIKIEIVDRFACPGCKEKDAEKAQLRAEIARLENNLDAEIKTRNAALHWKQVEIDKLEAEIAIQEESHESAMCGAANTIAELETNAKIDWEKCKGYVTNAKLDSILAILEQWEPAKGAK